MNERCSDCFSRIRQYFMKGASSRCSSRFRSRSICFSFFTPLRSALSSPTQRFNVISMLMTQLFISFSILQISHKAFLTWKLSTLSLLGCQLIFTRSTSLKLNSYLLVFPNSSLKSLRLLFSCLIPMSRLLHLTWLVTSVSLFDSSLTMSDHISSVSKFYFLSTCDLRRIRNTLEYS